MFNQSRCRPTLVRKIQVSELYQQSSGVEANHPLPSLHQNQISSFSSSSVKKLNQ